MSDNILNAKTVSVVSDLAYLQASFTRPASDPNTVYSDADISLLLWKLDNRTLRPLATNADLILTIGQGLTRAENEINLQVITIAIAQADLALLLGEDLRRRIGYRWIFDVANGPSYSGFVGTEYDGIFTLVAPGIQAESVVR